MSTRCQIAIEGSPIKLYKHSDGYPEGVLPTLLPFVKDFFTRRGDQPDYFLARLTMTFGLEDLKEHEASRARVLKSQGAKAVKDYGYDKPNLLGFGLDAEWHGDIEYRYLVDALGTTVVEKRIGDWSNPQWQPIEIHKLRRQRSRKTA